MNFIYSRPKHVMQGTQDSIQIRLNSSKMIPEVQVQDLGFRKKNVNTSRESFGSPKFQTNYEFSMAIPSSEQIDNQNKQFMKTRYVV
jgi:hypothetical protein